jgi:large subunit ribosomal protein LP2
MRHVAALLLCVLGGNDSPSAADIEKVISSFGGEVDSEKVELLLKELEGKNIEEVIAAGKEKLSTVSIGAAPAGGAAAGAAAGGAAAAPAVEEKVEEEEADIGGGMDMFGGGSDY